MARLRRWFEEGLSVHIHQRGNNRADMFHDTTDRVVFLMALLESSRRYGVGLPGGSSGPSCGGFCCTPQVSDWRVKLSAKNQGL